MQPVRGCTCLAFLDLSCGIGTQSIGISISPRGPAITAWRRCCKRYCTLQIEYRVQSSMYADQVRYLVNGEQSPIDVRAGTTARVVADCQSLIGHAEDYLGADHVSGQSNRVNLGTGQCGTAGLPRPYSRVHGHGRFGTTHFRQARREFPGRPTRRIDPIAVRIVNDFPLRNGLGGRFSKLLPQHDCQGKIAAGDDPSLSPACLRDTAATSTRSAVRAIERASSEPAQPVAPARHTLIAMEFVSCSLRF